MTTVGQDRIVLNKYYEKDIDVSMKKVYNCAIDSADYVIQPYTVNSYTNNSVSVSCSVTALQTLIDRTNIYLQLPLQFTDTVSGVACEYTTDFVSQNAFHNNATTASVNLSGSISSWEPNKSLSALSQRYQPNQLHTGTRNMPDQYMAYTNGSGAVVPWAAGDNRHPAAPYSAGCPQSPWTSGCLTNFGGTISGGTVPVLKFYLNEPVIVSPLVYGELKKVPSLFNFNTISFTYNFIYEKFLRSAVTNRVWSPVNGTIWQSPPVLYFVYKTISPTIKVPDIIAWPINNMQTFIQTNSTLLTPGAGTNINLGNIDLQSIAGLATIYARPSPSQPNGSTFPAYNSPQYPDTYGVLPAVDVQFNNKLVLTSLASKDWHNLSCINGSLQTYQQYSCDMLGNADTVLASGGMAYDNVPMTSRPGPGSVIFLKAGNFGLEENVCAGSKGKFNLKLSATVLNPYLATTSVEGFYASFDLYCVVSSDGLFTLDTRSGSLIQLYGAVTADQLNAAPYTATDMETNDNLFGSGIYDTVKNVARKVFNFGQKVGRVAGPVARYVTPHLKNSGHPRLEEAGRYTEAIGNFLGKHGLGRRGRSSSRRRGGRRRHRRSGSVSTVGSAVSSRRSSRRSSRAGSVSSRRSSRVSSRSSRSSRSRGGRYRRVKFSAMRRRTGGAKRPARRRVGRPRGRGLSGGARGGARLSMRNLQSGSDSAYD